MFPIGTAGEYTVTSSLGRDSYPVSAPGYAIPTGYKERKEGMKNHSSLILKIGATVLLVSAFVIISIFVVLMAPIYILLAFRGHAKASTLVEIIPLGIIGTFIWKIWKKEGMSDTERAYYDGIALGQVKAAKKQGMIVGAGMIARTEDLSLRPIYNNRPKRNSQLTASDPIPYA